MKSKFFATPIATSSPQSAKLTAHPTHQESPITISSRSTTPSSSSSSSESESSDGGSSPDSIKTELMLFKPISREPRTTSANATLIRVPSIRSTSSASSVKVHSPCPSPFFIPLTPCRQSAFTFVVQNQSPPLPPPKTNKRKYTKLSPEKKSEVASKRQKNSKVAEKSVEVNKRPIRKNIAADIPSISKKTENIRETRNNKRNSEPIKEFKSPQKKRATRNSFAPKAPVIILDDPLRRVTRSMKY